MKRILALDLGTKTGWALTSPSGEVYAGTKVLARPSEITRWRRLRLDRRCDPRVVLLHSWLCSIRSYADIVVFEDVEFQSYRMQCQLWSSFRTAVWLAFAPEQVDCVSVQTLKKFAGRGGADKNMMARQLHREDPGRFAIDKTLPKGTYIKDLRGHKYGGDTYLTDDAVDAIWIHKWAQTTYKITK